MTEGVDWSIWNAIHTRLQSFADAFDRADVDGVLSLFCHDAVWDHGPEGIRRGHGDIGTFLRERLAGYAQTSHHVGPPVVRAAEAPDRFESTAYLVATHVRHGGDAYTGYGRYVSAFRFEGGALLIGRHRVVAHVTLGAARPVHQLQRHGAVAPGV